MRVLVSWVGVVLLMAACAEVDVGFGNTSTTSHSPGGGLVFVESTEILYLESFPVQVRLSVRGSLPTPCHELQWEIEESGSRIDVWLWSEPDPEDDCISVLEPFEVSIPLGSFETASIPVFLNGAEVGRVSIGEEPIAVDGSLVGAGWSFGMCGGYCNADLVVERDGLTLTGREQMTDETLFVNRGTLTVEGLDRIGAELERLNDVPLDPVYGCPDCADGGASYLTLSRRGLTARHDMEFGRPPEVIAGLHSLTMAMISSLETCRSSDLVSVADDCAPWQEP